MMYSIYHFFAKLIRERTSLRASTVLEQLPVLQDRSWFSCVNVGQFPDRIIRTNPSPSAYTGGELLELKDPKSYTVSSFNSTIPSGNKNIADFLTPNIRAQMTTAGEDIEGLPVRDVFYMVRGRSPDQTYTKICLIHGCFFETIPVSQLISQAFGQILEERLGTNLDEATKLAIISALTDQSSFSRVRNVPEASVKPRFRLMTEVKREANLLNGHQYPEIVDDSLNLVIPIRDPEADQGIVQLARDALGDLFELVQTKHVKHPLNGWFVVFQCPLI